MTEGEKRNAYQKKWRAKNRAKVAAIKRKSLLKRKSEGYKLKHVPYDAASKAIKERYKMNNRDKLLASRKAWKKKQRYVNRGSLMLECSQQNARLKGVPCTLTSKWFNERLSAGACELTGLPFDLAGRKTPLSPSCDRIDPGGPYSPENCRVICWWLNRALSNNGLDFAIDIFKRVIERQPTT